MARYQWNKTIGGLLFASIFAGWMVIQWSSVAMRFVAGGLMVVTAWVTIASVVADVRRSRGRQLAVEPGRLIIESPGDRRVIDVTQVARAQWRNTPEPILTLYDAEGVVVAELDAAFLADESEARTFLGWARQRTDLPFEVDWPPAPI